MQVHRVNPGNLAIPVTKATQGTTFRSPITGFAGQLLNQNLTLPQVLAY